MKQLIRVIICFIIFSFSSCTHLKTEEGETLWFDSEPGWEIGYHYIDRATKYIITQFIREGEDIHNWKELKTVQTFYLKRWKGPQHPQAFINAQRQLRESMCPKKTKWNVIKQDENSILYEWQSKPCKHNYDQHEIAKVIYGKHNLFVLHYVAKDYQLNEAIRKKWVKRFSDAKIILKELN